MPKIDVIIGNPPYANGVYFKHLEKAYIDSARIVCFLQPIAWIHAQKPGRNSLKEKADHIKELVGNNFVNFYIFNPNKVFNIKYGQICGIVLIDKNKTESSKIEIEDTTLNKKTVVNNSAEINPFYMDSKKFNNIKNKIWNYCKQNNIQNNINKNNGSFFVNLPLISGHVDESGSTDNFFKSDFYQLIYEIDKKVSYSPKANKQTRWLSFDTKEKANNCINYLSTSKLAKFSLMIVKNQQNLHRGELLYVPFFDFSTNIEDEKIFKILNLDEEEIQIIEEITK